MNKPFNYLAITSCFVLSTTLAHANPDSSQGNMHDQMFKTMDSNSDGMVTRDEFNNFGAKKFQELDANGDGQITGEEINAAHKKMEGSGGVRNRMDDSGRDPKGKERSQWDNANSRNQSTTGGRSNSSWTPQDSGGNRSGNDSWDKKRDDAWHKNSDSTWDKNRDDAWHKSNDNDNN